jgi:hypothetical protein
MMGNLHIAFSKQVLQCVSEAPNKQGAFQTQLYPVIECRHSAVVVGFAGVNMGCE